ncbi:unnamed protein product [Gongylonema pulchrum]|uniref:Secreted protein n=1 Tax=Gongylonema pulchrum TaxID=637853 RepID=A0A183E7K9_9BILA|nr:unnamed protein product [Gongylonema pulchrum]
MGLWSTTVATTSAAISATTALHKQGAFDMDSMALYRALLVISLLIVIIGAWIVIRFLRHNNGPRIRRYDVLSSKQLAAEQGVASEDSDEELFGSLQLDDTRRLVSESAPR